VFEERLRGALVTLVRDAMRGVAYLRLVRGRVVHVHSGGAVDTQPETQGAAQHSELPARYGLPGVLRAVARAGARVLVGHAEGDPGQPFVTSWDPGQLEELVFDVDGGAQPLARSGDSVAVGTLAFAGSGGSLVITYTPPSGAPQVVTLAIAGVGGTGTLTLSGIITGTSRVKA
jgi:hypothetical protein